MSNPIVIVEKKENIASFILNRPRVMNALNREMTEALHDAFKSVAADENIKVVILEGAGGNFSSGADMALFEENHSAPEWLAGMRMLGRLIRRIREIPQPVITKLRGAAFGGGANLVLSGDFVIAAHEARFCESFIHIGVILDSGGTYFLPRLVGLAKAREIALLGETLGGKKAESMGLIYKSVPDADLDAEVMSLAEQLSQKSRTAMALIKDGLENSFNMSLKDVMDWEAAHQAIMLRSPEHQAIVKMFLDARRKAKTKKD